MRSRRATRCSSARSAARAGTIRMRWSARSRPSSRSGVASSCSRNLRPVTVLPALVPASPVRPEVLEGVDLLIVRELTSGLYFGRPSEQRDTPEGRVGIDTLWYTEGEIRRVVRLAFELAQGRRGRLTSVDKANVLATSRLWRKVVEEQRADFPDVEVNHQLVDSCAMLLVRRPAAFDVLVTENLFGDILSDEAAVLAGSLGMLPSASLGERRTAHGRFGLYEPIHGSAPDIAGRDLANPAGTILSAAMLLRWSLGLEAAAASIEAAVAAAIDAGYRTADLLPPDGDRTGLHGRRHPRDDGGHHRATRRAGRGGVVTGPAGAPVVLYDTTLRDGTQGENITLSLADKLRVARLLDEYGMPYVEGGWPGSNPKDVEFFRAAKDAPLGDREARRLRLDAPPLERRQGRPEPGRAAPRRDARRHDLRQELGAARHRGPRRDPRGEPRDDRRECPADRRRGPRARLRRGALLRRLQGESGLRAPDAARGARRRAPARWSCATRTAAR